MPENKQLASVPGQCDLKGVSAWSKRRKTNDTSQSSIEVLDLEFVERTPTTAVAAGRLRRQRVAIAFEAEARLSGGSQLVTETRVGDVDLAFRFYWLVVGRFSALIRHPWLRAVARGVGP